MRIQPSLKHPVHSYYILWFHYCRPFSSPHFCVITFPKRESDTRFSTSGFFHESVSPRFSWGRFEFFWKFAEIFANEYLSLVSTTPAKNLSLVSTTPTPRIFEKFEMVLMGYSGARGTLIYEKNLMSKISCQTPFNPISGPVWYIRPYIPPHCKA